MDLSKFNARAAGARIENRWLRWVALGLLATNILLAIGMFSTQAVVTIAPPGMNKAVRVSVNQASATYKRAWGVFLTDLLGNVKPGGVDFILDTLTPLLAPSLYRAVVDAIHAQAAKIERDQVSVSFTPKKVVYDPNTDTVYVTGRQVSAGPGSDPVRANRTYEFTITIAHYQPVVTHMSVYDGGPRTKENR